MNNNKNSRLEITELFLATAGEDFSRCFHGTIKRGLDSDGNPKVWGKIDVNGTSVLSCARDQIILGNRLDQIILMVLDYGLLEIHGEYTDILGINCFSN